MHITKFTYQILHILAVPKIHNNLLWDLTFLFLVLGGLYFLFIFFFRNKLSKNTQKTKLKRQELAPTISNFLFHSPEDPKTEQKEYVELKINIRDYLNDRKFRKVISQILLDLQKDVAGGTRERLFTLYKELELHHDAFKKLESWRWETVSQGILELSQMEVQESYQLIKKFINDRRGVVRKQAELATVGLSNEGVNYFLDTTKNAISEWQQLKLIETLGKIKNYRPPQFKGWLLSQNKDVVLFALRLIKHYNQKGAEPSINELVKHKNDEIRIAAIQCIVDFNFESALPILKKVFNSSSNLVKISILNAVAALGKETDVLFLSEVAAKERSFIIVGKAQSAINSITPDAILPSKDIVRIEEKMDKVHEGEDPQNALDTSNVNELLVNFEEVENPIPDSIEVEDIEFYDEIEIPEKKEKEPTNEIYIPAFELNPIEDEYGNSMDELLGLVASDEADFDSNGLLEVYEKLSFEKKSLLLEKLEESGDKREIPLLEHITEHETDSELRFRAFKIVQSLKSQPDIIREKPESVKEVELPLEQQSIFYSLFGHAADLDSKLILIKEIEDIGGRKEIPFLESLLPNATNVLAKALQQAINVISNRPEKIPESFDLSSYQNEEEQTEEHSTKAPFKDQKDATDERIPMELLFLYEELGIASSEPKQNEEESLFDFELSPDFYSNKDPQIN